MEPHATNNPGLHLVNGKPKPVKRTRRRRADPCPVMAEMAVGMARRTRKLKNTAENLLIREVEVVFYMAQHALDLAYGKVSAFGKPMGIAVESTPTVREQLQQFRGTA